MSLAAMAVGCATVVPLQSASAVPQGTWQVGGQLALSPWCSLSGDLVARCAELPEGVPLPEVRVQGRTGVAEGMDVGLSLFAAPRVPPGTGMGPALRGGLYVEGKRELAWRSLGEGRRQGVSLAPGLGVSLAPEGLRGALSPQLDLALPVLFGHQTEGWEWVAGAQVVERLVWQPGAADPEQRFGARTELGLVLGAVGRGPVHLGWQLGYRAPVNALAGGSFTLGLGLAVDVVR